MLERSGDNDEILRMTGSLHKRNVIIDRMKDGCKDVLLRMKDAGFGCMRDESETCSRDSRMKDELFVEVEDSFS